MTKYVVRGGLEVAGELADLVESEILPGLNMTAGHIWSGLEGLIRDFSPRNAALLRVREELQKSLDTWHADHRDNWNGEEYKNFLYDLGYLTEEGADFQISPGNSDPEVSVLAGPQLVVPVDNARYALNAANARWGSLFDALYGTDVIPHQETETTGYDRHRGGLVIERANRFLDSHLPLAGASHGDVVAYHIEDIAGQSVFRASLQNGREAGLADKTLFIGHHYEGEALHILFRHHGLHVEIVVDRKHPVGADNLSGVRDVMLESALTAIMDCEDSVAAVDAADKVKVYRNWCGLMKGDLTIDFMKEGRKTVRRLNPDRRYRDIQGQDFELPGRSLMLVRNVGHLMTTDAVRAADGSDIPEGILDALITSLAALHDLNGTGQYRNSRTGSIYIVKPKMHGPDEAAFANDLFDRVEDILGLLRHSIKIGVMDEERRTTVNLKECIRAVKDRIFFINTGFLDRTGDEIHTDMEAGPVSRKNAMKDEVWIDAYERWNVDVGLAAGMSGKAQIGKGMWAMPGEMRQMLAVKGAQLVAGASCAWVPSPTAATLHAMHYHEYDVPALQEGLRLRPRASLDDLLTLPLLAGGSLGAEDIKNELDNNAQGLLGYVVRWINQGIGCSKVPDINDVGLMEDRATLRISSQHMANWLHHDICTEEQVRETLRRMAMVVDGQNAGDPHYQPMAPDYDGAAFLAACDLVFKGRAQPCGYTEPILHAWRRAVKAAQ